MKTVRVLSLPVDTTGCGYYRIRQPYHMIPQHTMHDAHVLEASDPGDAVVYALRNSSFVMARQGAERSIRQILEIPEFKNIKWGIDIDDHPGIVSPYSDHYAEGGLEEYYDRNAGKWLWKDGRDGFDIERNKKTLKSLEDGFKEAHLVTVTTERLAEYIRQFNKNVAVLPNCIDLKRWWKLPIPTRTEPSELRIGWSGGSSHFEDWVSIRKPLNKLLRKYKFKIIFVGVSWSGVIDDDLKHLVEYYDWDAWKAHSYRMMCVNLDLAIIPLADLPFNHYKSTIKLVEMSGMGVPSLVSRVPPYTDDINEAVNCYSYDGEAEFEHQLEFLIRNPEVREQIGNNAYVWARENYNAAQNAHLWTDAYLNAIDNS